jgi:YD repeat-containing protein
LPKKTWGARVYPVQYGYDPQGRRTNMVTWQNYAGSQGQATTAWGLDPYRGFLLSKTYHGGAAGPGYAYTGAGRLASRAWARGITSYLTNNTAGDLVGLGYSGTTNTANVVYTLDHRGRPQQISAGSSYTAGRLHDDAGRLLSESYSAGPLAGLTVSNNYDALGRRTMNGLWSGSAWLVQSFFGYDGASRLAGVTNGDFSATYSYLANSPLVSDIVFRSNTVTVMTTTKQFDFRSRLTKIESWAGSTLVARAAYGYNAADQRVALTNADNSYWLYGYDSLGQVTSGKRYWSNGTPVLGQQFDYTFDDIGNRKVAVTGGDQWGANKRHQNYAATLLNQYSHRTVPGYLEVLPPPIYEPRGMKYPE